MKKLVCLILSVLITIALAIPAFAADTAKFKLNIVSENDKQIVLSVDYEGGVSFACFDFELDYNIKKLKATSAVKGGGLKSFIEHAESNGGIAIASINNTANPIKATCATTVSYRTVEGKDLFVIKFDKLTKEKLDSSDVSLYFSNCQTAEFADIQTEITSALPTAPGNKTEAPVNTEQGKTESKPDDKTSATDSTEKTQEDATNESAEPVVGEEEITTAEDAELAANPTAKMQKIILISAAALCLVVVAVAVVIYVMKKNKDKSAADE